MSRNNNGSLAGGLVVLVISFGLIALISDSCLHWIVLPAIIVAVSWAAAAMDGNSSGGRRR